MNSINPGEGYRILGPDEKIIDGDEGRWDDTRVDHFWFAATSSAGEKASYVSGFVWRRKIDMSNPSQKYDPLLNKWARLKASGSIVQLRSLTNHGMRIIEFINGNVSVVAGEVFEVLEKCTGYHWKEEKTLVVGCKTLSKNGNIVLCNGQALCHVNSLNNAILHIKNTAHSLNSVCESMLFTDNRGQHHSVKFSDIENFLGD